MKVTAVTLTRDDRTGLCTVSVTSEFLCRDLVVIADAGDLIHHTVYLDRQRFRAPTLWQRLRFVVTGRMS